MTDDEETYAVIYAVTDQPVRAALLRLFGQHRNDRDTLMKYIEELQADAKTLNLAIGVGRWAGPIVVAIAAIGVNLL